MSGPLTPSTTHTAKEAGPHAGVTIASTGAADRFENLRPATPLPARKLIAVPSPAKAHHLPAPAAVATRDEPARASLTSPVTLRPAPRHSLLKRTGKFARRIAHLSMDAALILVFAPVIAGWLLIERRRRRVH